MIKSGLVTLELLYGKSLVPCVAGDLSSPFAKDAECASSAAIFGHCIGFKDHNGSGVPHDDASEDLIPWGGSSGDNDYGRHYGQYDPGEPIWPQDDDWVGDRDPNRDRAPRPERKKFPWSFSFFATVHIKGPPLCASSLIHQSAH